MERLPPALGSWDIVPLVLAHLNRRQAAAAACVCKPWKEAIASMSKASKFPFRPQIMIGLARQGKVVDITDLVLPQMLPAPPLAWGVHTYRAASDKSKRAPVWLTSLAFSPHAGRHLYTCQYQAKGITQHHGGTLKYKKILISLGNLTKEPEGITFSQSYMYVQNNWGEISGFSAVCPDLRGPARDGHLDPGWVTWALKAGPDGALYVSADQEYESKVYTEVPQETTGCVFRVPTDQPHGNVGKVFTKIPMKRPCGLCFGPNCGNLFVTCLDPCLMHFAGPAHAQPGVLLNRISLQPEGLLPWDVVVLGGSTLVVSMHWHKYVHRPRRKKGAAQASSSSASSSQGPAAQADENDVDVDVQGRSSTHHGVDADRGYLCIMENLGQGPTRVVQLPEWMDHANMMAVAE